MTRATTKTDLTTSANGQFEKMWKIIDSMSEELQTATFSEEMAVAGKEAHWGRDKMCLCICTSGIICCWIGFKPIVTANLNPFFPNHIIGGHIRQ